MRSGVEPIPDLDSKVPGMHIWGWMCEEELTFLGDEAEKMDSIVEIGSLHGRSAFALLTACSGTVYCIDPWNDEHDKSYPSFISNCGHFTNLRAVRSFSPQATRRVPEKVDMVFIDGDHEYESVLADIEAWLPKTQKLICGHDYLNEDGGYPGVAQAVHEVFGRDGIEVPEDTAIWAVRL